MVTRKNVAALSAAERQAYVSALKALKNAPSRFNPPTNSRYDDYVYVHMQAMLELQITDRTRPVENGNWTNPERAMRMPMWAHRCSAFLPWHRELLYQFERDLQAVAGNSTLAIPYWDWSTDQSPTGPPWLTDFMGGDGQDGPITTGPFAGATSWKITLSEDGGTEIVRGFGLAAGYSRLPTPAEVNATLMATPYDGAPWNDHATLATYRNQLEGWHVPAGSTVAVGMHNLVHVWVGGKNGTMLPSTSPNDPVFFLHHCNVDRLWAVWQLQHASTSPYLPTTPLPGDPGQSLNEPMIFYDPSLSSTPPWNDPPATPASVVDHHGLGYKFDFEQDQTPAAMPMALVSPTRRRVKINAEDHFRVRTEDLEQI